MLSDEEIAETEKREAIEHKAGDWCPLIRDHAFVPIPADTRGSLALDAAEALWGVVANAGGGDWGKESLEWCEAAARARDMYHAALDNRAADTRAEITPNATPETCSTTAGRHVWHDGAKTCACGSADRVRHRLKVGDACPRCGTRMTDKTLGIVRRAGKPVGTRCRTCDAAGQMARTRVAREHTES